MPDFYQFGAVTTLHDLGTAALESLEELLRKCTRNHKIGLVLPVTASDMRAEPFGQIVHQLAAADYIESVVITLGVAPNAHDYRDTVKAVEPLGDKASVLWTDGPRIQQHYQTLIEAGFPLQTPGKGRSVWTAFGFLLGDPQIKTFALHDCDIVDYDRELLARLCLPMAHPSLDFEFCKAYYARVTDRMHGRAVRLLVAPLLGSLITLLGEEALLIYLRSFRYPLSGEFAVTSNLARSNRIPSDWGLEIGTLAEVFRNTSVKRVCQVDLCRLYEHKHQALSMDDPNRGLQKMATDVVTTLFRTLASRGVVLDSAHFATLRSCYLRSAQDAIRQYHADALINGLQYDRHLEEQAVEAFAERIMTAGSQFSEHPAEGAAIPNWTRVLTVLPEFPQHLRDAVDADNAEHA